MRVRNIISSTLLSLALGVTAQTSVQGADSSSDVERDFYFSVIEKVVSKDLSTIAESSIADFRSKKFDKGAAYADVLRVHYCRTFESMSAELSVELKKLSKSIDVNSLPDALKKIVEDKLIAGRTARYANPILRTLNPDSPPETLSPAKKKLIERRVQLLTEKALETMAALRVGIDANKELEDKQEAGDLDNKESNKVLRNAVYMRYAWANEFYSAFTALREVLYHGADYGIDSQAADAFIGVCLEDLDKATEILEWDLNYGDYLLGLRHRLLIMKSELARTGNKYGYYSETLGGLRDILDLSVSDYPKGQQAGIVSIQLKTLSDTLLWHEGMEGNREQLLAADVKNAAASKHKKRTIVRPNYAEEGLKIWEQYRATLRVDDMLRGRDKWKKQTAQQLYFTVARLHRANGDVGSALGLVGIIAQDKKMHYYVNAKNWKKFLVKAPGVVRNWYAPARAVDPKQALDTAQELFAGARSEDDDEQREKMYRNAAMVLRDGVLGLQETQWRKQWVTSGPQVYERYASALYKMDDIELAAHVALEGATAYASLWSRSHNKKHYFKNSDGTANAVGEHVERLVRNMNIYTSKLRRVDTSAAGQELYQRNLALLKKAYKDVDTGMSPKGAIVGLINNKSYAEAIDGIEAYAQTEISASDKIWASRLTAYTFYQMWDAAKRSKQTDGLAAMEEKLHAALAALKDSIATLSTEKGASEEGAKAESIRLAIFIGVAFRNEEYVTVLEALDEDYWKNPPTDSKVLQKLASQMSTACYKYHAKLMKLKDPVELVKNWGHFERAYTALMFVREKTGVALDNSGKALAIALKNVGTLANWCMENRDALVAFDVVKMSQATKRAPELYGNLMVPLVSKPGVSLTEVLGVAQILSKAGDSRRSAILFEKYLTEIQNDTELQGFKADPKDILTVTRKAVLDARGGWKTQWAVIYDLLFDKAGFDPEKDDSEVRRNFNTAHRKLVAFIAVVKKKKSALGKKYKPAMDALVKLDDMAKKLSYFVVVQDLVVQAHIANGNMDKALPYIKALIAYDPLNPRYKALSVDVVLTQARTSGNVDKQELKNARGIASTLLRSYKGKASKFNEYWLAYCQAYELTAMLGEPEKISKSLQRHLIGIAPILLDIAIESEGSVFTPRDAAAAQLIRRYHALYSIKGVTTVSNLMMKTVGNGLTITLKNAGE